MTGKAVARRAEGLIFGRTVQDAVRALIDEGLLVDELPVEPLPEKQRRADPFGAAETVVKVRGFWVSTEDKPARRDDDVRDWPILVPETDLDDLRAECDRLRAELDQMTTWRNRAADHLRESETDLDDLRAERDWLAGRVNSLRSDLSRSRIHGGNQAAEITRLLARVSELEAAGECVVDADALAHAIREHLPAATRPPLPEGHIALDLRAISAETLRRQVEANPPYSILHIAVRAELDRRAKAGEG